MINSCCPTLWILQLLPYGKFIELTFFSRYQQKIIVHHHDGLYFPAISVEIKQVGLLKILFMVHPEFGVMAL